MGRWGLGGATLLIPANLNTQAFVCSPVDFQMSGTKGPQESLEARPILHKKSQALNFKVLIFKHNAKCKL